MKILRVLAPVFLSLIVVAGFSGCRAPDTVSKSPPVSAPQKVVPRTVTPAPDAVWTRAPEGDYRVHLNSRLIGLGHSDGAHLSFGVRAFAQSLGFYSHWQNGNAYIAGRRVPDARIDSAGRAVAPLPEMARRSGLKVEILGDDMTAIISR